MLMPARMGARKCLWTTCSSEVLPLVVNGNVLAQFLKSLMDKSCSAKVACTPSFWARLFYIKSTMDDS